MNAAATKLITTALECDNVCVHRKQRQLVVSTHDACVPDNGDVKALLCYVEGTAVFYSIYRIQVSHKRAMFDQTNRVLCPKTSH